MPPKLKPKKSVACFTGPSRIPEDKAERAIVAYLRENPISLAYLSGATGWDEAARKACLRLEIPHKICIPHPDYRKYWDDKQRGLEYDFMLATSDVVFVSPASKKFSPGLNLRRNEYMVLRSELVIASVTPSAVVRGVRSGEAATVRYAIKKRVPVFYMNDW